MNPKRFNVVIDGQRQTPKIDFTVMGLDSITSDFLNWCMRSRDNLEYIKQNGVLDLQSSNAVLYFNDLKVIQRIDKTTVDKRGA